MRALAAVMLALALAPLGATGAARAQATAPAPTAAPVAASRHHDAIADAHAEPAQRARHACRPGVDVAVRERLAVGHPEEDVVAAIGERGAQRGVQVGVHGSEHRTATPAERAAAILGAC